MKSRHTLLAARAAALAAMLLAVWMVTPAQACGCGGYIPHDGQASVSQEQALLRWDGKTEDILMSLGVLGSSSEAAVILPVPSRATVTLGQAGVWDELSQLTLPLIRHEKHYVLPLPLMIGAAAPGAGAPVTVLERQTLGPFEVSNLAATDSAAMADWLSTNGYQMSPGLATAFQPYVAQGWFYVAVRLRPGTGAGLSGTLDPLRVSFGSSQLVYPMRGSANAPGSESVTLYVLADHRVAKPQDFGGSHVPYADWVEPAALAPGSALASFVDRRLFLTKFQEQVDPQRVSDDFKFSFTGQDEISHDVVVVLDDDYSPFYLGLGCLCLVIVLAFAAAVVLGLRFGRRKPAAT
jgi:hypothetical protein